MRRAPSAVAGTVAVVVAATILAVPARSPAASPRPVAVGLAEQKASVFADPFFRRLMLRHARLHVGWDVLHNAWERERTDAWMRGAERLGIEPLVTFGRSRIDHRRTPTPRQFARELRAFRERWPQVRRFGTWNEVNHRGQRTLDRPELVARWWRALRKACPRCTILPAELLDTPNMLTWVRRFRRVAGSEPAVWGVHSYAEANRFRTARMRALLRRVRGRIWLTEVGGIVRRRDRLRASAFPESPEHAARVVRFIFSDVVPLSRRIERVYVYNWSAATTKDTWDSALVDAAGRPRPAWYALLEAVAETRMG